MAEVAWDHLKAQEIRQLAAEGAAVILPIASIEQHGPQLPTMTDSRLGQEIALRTARRAWPSRKTIVTPVVWSGLSEHHMPFGGTLSISHSTFRALVRDLIFCLHRNGFRHVLISNSHGGNITSMKQIIDEVSFEVPDMVLVGVTYPTEAVDAYGEILEDQPNIGHACEGETSMMLAVVPKLVDTERLSELGTRANDPSYTIGKSAHRMRPLAHTTGDGVVGNPTRANADKGERLIDAAAEALAAIITDPATWAPNEDRRGTSAGGYPFADKV